MNVTITSMEFQEVVTSEEVTPFGQKHVRETPVNLIRATWTADGLAEQTHFFPREAIADRLDRYRLPSLVHALEAIVREVIFQWLPDLAPLDPENPNDCQGGVDKRITVTWADGVQASGAAIAADQIDAIRAFLEPMLPPREPEPRETPEPPQAVTPATM